VKKLKQEIGRPIAQLIRDLEKRGRLDRTLAIIASEFCRDMMIESVPGSNAKDQSCARTEKFAEIKHYSLHRHFSSGVKNGFIYGKTADERPPVVVENPDSVEDFHATIFTTMGISPKTAYEFEKRPFFLTKDVMGKPAMDIFT
jgi:hypothetical protein